MLLGGGRRTVTERAARLGGEKEPRLISEGEEGGKILGGGKGKFGTAPLTAETTERDRKRNIQRDGKLENSRS